MRDVFEILAEMDAKIDHGVGRFTVVFPDGRRMGLALAHPSTPEMGLRPAETAWPSFPTLSTVIEWAKDIVPGEWCLVLNRAEARQLWNALSPHDQLMVRLFRPKGTPVGWMMSFDGIDIVERRA